MQAPGAGGSGGWSNLPRDLASDIHSRLGFLDRLAFTAVFGEAFKQEAPWLLLPGTAPETAKVFSLADRRVATVRAPDPALRGGHIILGSSGGWLVTADGQARLHMINPVTGQQAALPAITTIPSLDALDPWFRLAVKPFNDIRYGGQPSDEELDPMVSAMKLLQEEEEAPTLTLTAAEMRFSFYAKVVLSASPRPGGYSAMLILDRRFGAPAFATAEGAAWTLAPSRDGIEDAIHHDGRFYSVTFSGVVEAWEQEPDDSGCFTSKVVTSSRLASDDDYWRGRKYLAAAPDGRLLLVLKDSRKKYRYGWTRGSCRYWSWTRCFTVQVLLDDGRWERTDDIGEAALFVGVNSSLCVSTREHRELMAGCVYFTDDELEKAALRTETHDRLYSLHLPCGEQEVGVYSLKDGKVKEIEALGCHSSWPLPAWFTPSVSI